MSQLTWITVGIFPIQATISLIVPVGSLAVVLVIVGVVTGVVVVVSVETVDDDETVVLWVSDSPSLPT